MSSSLPPQTRTFFRTTFHLPVHFDILPRTSPPLLDSQLFKCTPGLFSSPSCSFNECHQNAHFWNAGKTSSLRDPVPVLPSFTTQLFSVKASQTHQYGEFPKKYRLLGLFLWGENNIYILHMCSLLIV